MKRAVDMCLCLVYYISLSKQILVNNSSHTQSCLKYGLSLTDGTRPDQFDQPPGPSILLNSSETRHPKNTPSNVNLGSQRHVSQKRDSAYRLPSDPADPDLLPPRHFCQDFPVVSLSIKLPTLWNLVVRLGVTSATQFSPVTACLESIF